MWSFLTTSVNQVWEPMTFGMAPWHLDENADKQKSKEALQSQSPIAAFKACNVIQAIGIAYSKIVLPNGDSAGESKKQDILPYYMEQFIYTAIFSRVCRSIASIPTCKCYWCVTSSAGWKSVNHPNCAFADSASTVMCGAMISLTPRIAPTVERECDLHEHAEFQSVIEKLNDILSKPPGFPPIPLPRKDCHIVTFPPNKRHKHYVMSD